MNRDQLFTTLSLYLPWAFSIGVIIMVASDLLSISLNSQYNPIHETVSELVHYPHSWIIITGLITVTLIHILLATTSLSSPASQHHRLVRLAGILFALIGFGFIIIIVFQTDPGEEISTLAGRIHVVTVAVISTLLPIAYGSLTIALWHHRKSETLIVFTAIIAVVSLFIAWQLMPQNDPENIGAYERLFGFVNLSWLIMAGFRFPKLLSTH